MTWEGVDVVVQIYPTPGMPLANAQVSPWSCLTHHPRHGYILRHSTRHAPGQPGPYMPYHWHHISVTYQACPWPTSQYTPGMLLVMSLIGDTLHSRLGPSCIRIGWLHVSNTHQVCPWPTCPQGHATIGYTSGMPLANTF